MISYCENCEQSKKDLNEAKLKLNEFQNLAKRIVQTDLLLRKFSEKEIECNKLTDDLDNKRRENDSLYDKNKTLSKENEKIKLENKKLIEEKSIIEKNLQEALENLKNSNNKEAHLNDRLNEIKTEYELKISSQTKQFDDLNAQYKTLKENFENVSAELKKSLAKINDNQANTTIAEKSYYKNNQTSTQILNRNVSSSFETEIENKSQSEEKAVFKGFYLGSDESEEENEIDNKALSISNLEKQTNIGSSEKESKNVTNQDLFMDKIDKSIKENVQNNESKLANDNTKDDMDVSDSSDTESTDSDSSSSSSSMFSSFESKKSPKSKSSTSNSQIEDIFGFKISDDEENEKSIEVESIQKEFETNTKASDTNNENLENEIKEKENKERKEKETKENEERLKREAQEKINKELEEKDKKIDKMVDEFSLTQQNNLFDELLDQITMEYNIIEFIRDKLLNEEISAKDSLTSNVIRSICISSIEEEKAEKKRIEKKFREEFKTQMEDEIYEKIFTDKFNELIRECCERVLSENLNEKVNNIYFNIIDELYKETFEKCLLELIFDEMNSLTKPLMCKLKPLVKKLETKTIESPVTRLSKRPVSTDSEDSIKSPFQSVTKKIKSNFPTEEVEKKFSIAKFKSTHIEETLDIEQQFRKKERFHQNDEEKELEDFIKGCLSDYFKKFNYKVTFTFDELDELIDQLAKTVMEKNSETDNKFESKFISRILVKHYINNRFIPLDENKLNQVDDNELKLFMQTNMNNKQKEQSFRSKSLKSNDSYSSYLQNKLNQLMIVKITSEEEKYVYLIKKLIEYPDFENTREEFIYCLKILILSSDFIDSFNMRLGRMICFLCKSNKNVDFLNSFIYDLVATHNFTMPFLFQNLILLFARIWPESLTWPYSIYQTKSQFFDQDFELSTKKNPILFVIIYIVKKSIYKNNQQLDMTLKNPKINYSSYSDYYIYILETLCNWGLNYNDGSEIWNFMKDNLSLNSSLIVSSDIFILNDTEFKLNPLMFEYLLAFKLLCIYEGWGWTLETFLKKHIKQILEELSIKSADNSISGSSKIKIEHMISFYFLVQSNVTSQMCPNEDSDFQALELIREFGLLIKNLDSNKESRVFEFSLIESIVLLTPFNPTECFQILNNWINKHQLKLNNQTQLSIKIPMTIRDKINFAFNLYKDKIPNCIDIEF